MVDYVNKSGGTLILPDGTEVKAGDGADISADLAKNVAIKQWIAGGFLVTSKAKADTKDK
jgi:hypothetical protein